MNVEKGQKNTEGAELEIAAKHNIESAVHAVSALNNCSYAEAVEAVKKFTEFIIDILDKSLKVPERDEKSGSIPYNYSGHEIFEIGPGDKKKKIKMTNEANITYAAHVLQNKNQSTLSEAFDELRRQADLLLEEYERTAAKRK